VKAMNSKEDLSFHAYIRGIILFGFAEYIPETSVRLVGIEPEEAASLTKGTPGVLHGFKCLMLQDEVGNPLPTHSISAGLDYPGIGPEHSQLKVNGRAEYYTVSKKEVLDAFQELARTEGIIPALESAHAVAYVLKEAPKMAKDDIIIINVSGRGDKDVHEVSLLLENQ